MSIRPGCRGRAAASDIRLALRSLSMVATRSARFSRCVLRCQGSRSPSTALMLRAACSIPPIQTPNPSKNGPSSSRYPTVNHFRPKPIGGEAKRVGAMPRYYFSLVDGKHSAEDKSGKELDSLFEAHLHALRMFEKLIQFIPNSLSPTCHIKITSAAGEPVLTVFLPALAAEERLRRVLAHHLQRAQAWPR